MSPLAKPEDRVVVITGAARGIGLEWVKQYSKDPNTFVIAVVRSKTSATHLQQILNDKVVAVELDLTDFARFDSVAKEIGELTGGRVDLLINNAGVMIGAGASVSDKTEKSTVDEWQKTYNINTISPIFFTLALIPLLQQGKEKRVVNTSTFLASLDFHKATKGSLAFISYSASKIALNMASLKLQQDYQDQGFTIITLNPGYVQTDLAHSEQAKNNAPLTTEVSVARQKSFVDRLEPVHGGGDYSLEGLTTMVVA